MATIKSELDYIQEARSQLAEALITKFGVRKYDNAEDNPTLKGLWTVNADGSANQLKRLHDWALLVTGTNVHTDGSLIFKSDGAGDAVGTIFNGSVDKSISYNSIGAAAENHTHDERYLRLYTREDSLTSTDIMGGIYLYCVADTGGWATTATKPSGVDNAAAVLQIHTHTGDYNSQLMIDGTHGQLWMRNAYATTTWGNWQRFAYAGESYTKTESDNKYSLISHLHPYLPLAGGNMNQGAVITWPDDGNWGNSNSGVTFPYILGGLQWNCLSDSISLKAIATASDNLELVLQLGDDDSNGFQIRNASGTNTARIAATGVITGTNFSSTIATGTQPYACNSTTLNSNLNADLLDGNHASAFATAALGVGEIITIEKTITVLNSWTDTGISGEDLSSGTYIVQVYTGDTYLNNYFWYERFSGIMSWYSGTTNSTEADEIILHAAGHAPNALYLYLRTLRQATPNKLKLLIACETTLTSATYTFKFRKLI